MPPLPLVSRFFPFLPYERPEKPAGHGLSGPSRDKALGTRSSAGCGPGRALHTEALGSCDKVLIMFLTSKLRVIL